MPILWRYLLAQYLKVLLLCTGAFIGVLMLMRLDEIAHFATLGPEGLYILWFILYQIPYVLPMAIPISSLISAILLIQSLSTSHELTAWRASGLALRDILAPILTAAALLALLNFYIVSEMATKSHLTAGLLKSELRAVNPLLLLHNKKLMRLKGFYYDTLGNSQMGETASDVILAVPNKSNERLNVIIAKNLQATPLFFSGNKITLISSINSNNNEHFDHLIIENIGEAAISIEDFAQTFQKKVWTLNNDHLRLSLLLARLDEEKIDLSEARKAEAPISELKQITRGISRVYSEILRRISIALATFTFTLMGAAFGVSISRNRSMKGLYIVIFLGALYMMSYLIAKGIDHQLIAGGLLYIIPHCLIVMLSLLALRRAANGIE